MMGVGVTAYGDDPEPPEALLVVFHSFDEPARMKAIEIVRQVAPLDSVDRFRVLFSYGVDVYPEWAEVQYDAPHWRRMLTAVMELLNLPPLETLYDAATYMMTDQPGWNTFARRWAEAQGHGRVLDLVKEHNPAAADFLSGADENRPHTLQ
jgi:hypothetical protein